MRANVWVGRWLAAKPFDAAARLCAAQCEVSARRGSTALAQARRAFLLSPDDPASLTWLTRATFSASGNRELANARRWLPAVAERDSRVVAMVAQGQALAGDLEDAVGLLTRYAWTSRDRPHLLANAAGYLQRLGRPAASRSAFRHALTEVPDQLAAISAAQTAAEHRRDYAEA